MSSNKKTVFAGIFAVALACISFVLFIWLCWTAAAGEQGGVAFIFYAPVLLALVVSSFFLGRYAGPTNSIGKIGKRASIILAIFYITFYISPSLGFAPFTDGVIGAVAKSFKMISGESPMEWSRRNLRNPNPL
jgi:hypothetical protein